MDHVGMEELIQRLNNAAQEGNMMDELIQSLNNAAQEGDTRMLYQVIGGNHGVLEHIDKKPLVETPLHIAASAGQVGFAIEIFALKPSFGRKLNPSLLSPLHLAVPRLPQEEAAETARQKTEIAIRLINIDSELIRVQGKEMMTPLHYAAERNNRDLVAEFLCACPASIEDLTLRGDTAVHVAVRKRSTDALTVLLGWHLKVVPQFKQTQMSFLQFMTRDSNKGVLRWKNEDGDTALHIAASTNQNEVVKLLINSQLLPNLNDKNERFQTAFDLADEQGRNSLKKAGGLSSNSVDNWTSLADFMSGKEPFHTVPRSLSRDTANVVLVVAVLITTATFQLPLTVSTSGGGADNDHSSSLVYNNSTTAGNGNGNGITTTIGRKSIFKSPILFQLLVLFNSIAFFTSVGVIAFTLRYTFVTQLLQLCLFFQTITYLFLVASLSSPDDAPPIDFLLCLALFLLLGCFIRGKFFGYKKQRRTFSAISIGRYNPSRFFEMRRQMVGW